MELNLGSLINTYISDLWSSHHWVVYFHALFLVLIHWKYDYLDFYFLSPHFYFHFLFFCGLVEWILGYFFIQSGQSSILLIKFVVAAQIPAQLGWFSWLLSFRFHQYFKTNLYYHSSIYFLFVCKENSFM